MSRGGAEQETRQGRRLKRSARSFYNVADALVPPEGGQPGGGDLDLWPAFAAALRRAQPSVSTALLGGLSLIEVWPLLTLRATRPFSRLPRDRRAGVLRAFRESRLRWRRRLEAEVSRIVQDAHRAALPCERPAAGSEPSRPAPAGGP